MRPFLFFVALSCLTITVSAQTTAFTYQGRITNSSVPVNGVQEMTFKLFDAATGGTQIASITGNSTVTNGVFTAVLDFGSGAFNGDPRFLEVTIGTTVLTPRQQVTSAPYAIRARDAVSLNGVAASQFVQTTDPRLTDERAPTAGSGNYIQNQTANFQSADFKISGSGTIGSNASVQGGLTVDTNTLVVDAVGNRVGIGTATPSTHLSFGGDTSRTIRMERRISPEMGGLSLLIQAGGASVGATNRGGGSLILRSGISTGSSQASSIFFQTPSIGASGTADNAYDNRMTIEPDGQIGIGVAAQFLPSHRLHVIDPSNTGLRVQTDTIGGTVASFGGNGAFQIDAPSIPGGRFIVTESGNVGIGTATPGNILTVRQGSSFDPVADAWTTYSSRRWKTDIRTLEGSLDKVRRLRGVSYTTIGEGKQDIGLIAEEVGEVVPEVVAYEANGVDAKSVDYARINALLIEALKEQQKQIDDLKKLVCATNGQAAICKEQK